MIKLNYDFYNFINKDWLLNNPIPSDKSRWSQFDKLNETNNIKIKKIIENLPSNNNLKLLYDQYNKLEILDNNSKILDNNLEMIKKYLNNIDNFDNIDKLWIYILDLTLKLNINIPLLFYSHPDFNNSNYNILFISTGGLGLPNRESYFKETYKKNKDDYKIFIKEYSDLFSFNIISEKIIFFEELLAEKTYTSSQERDPNLLNNVRPIKEIINNYPKLTFINKLLEKYTNNNIKLINITNPKFIKLINELCNNNLLDIWKMYFKWQIMLSVNSYINITIQKKYLEFYNFNLKGEKIIEPTYIRSIKNIDNLLGQEIGILYKNNFFDNKIIDKINTIFKFIKKSIHNSFTENIWLKQETTERAIIKLLKMNIKIGYPNINGLKDYSKLKLSTTNNYLENIMLCINYNNNLLFEKLYTTRNKDIWFMNSHNINAYYSPIFNEIVIPAGILQEPFFYNDDKFVGHNFGGIGMIIGHEIIHGFDDKGKLYDENGNLNNWWDNEDLIKYKEKVNLLKKQFEDYIIMNYKINTELTIGENIADLGGIKFSLLALECYLNKNKDNKNSLEVFKNFFNNYAHIWASNIRQDFLKQKLLNDPHSPPIFRVNGIVKNIDKFYEIYNINDGNLFIDKNKRISIW